MRCGCGGKLHVTESRARGWGTFRRRRCDRCGTKTVTHEVEVSGVVSDEDYLVVGPAGVAVVLDRPRIAAAILEVLDKELPGRQ